MHSLLVFSVPTLDLLECAWLFTGVLCIILLRDVKIAKFQIVYIFDIKILSEMTFCMPKKKSNTVICCHILQVLSRHNLHP